jgi:RNA polymerase sigma-70 factor (ECF subfamily)
VESGGACIYGFWALDRVSNGQSRWYFPRGGGTLRRPFFSEITMALSLARSEDSALIELALAGQTDGFMVLMDRHLATVRRHIDSMVRNPTDGDDLLQEVLLKVWRHLSTFRAQSSFRTWMTRIAINEVFQSYRRERRRPFYQVLDDFDTFVSPSESPLQSLTRAETTQVVRKAVVELPAIYRQVLIFREFEQLSAREIAQSLHLSIPAVKTRLFRARFMLLAALQRTKAGDRALHVRNSERVSSRRARKRSL